MSEETKVMILLLAPFIMFIIAMIFAIMFDRAQEKEIWKDQVSKLNRTIKYEVFRSAYRTAPQNWELLYCSVKHDGVEIAFKTFRDCRQYKEWRSWLMENDKAAQKEVNDTAVLEGILKDYLVSKPTQKEVPNV